MVAQAGCHGGLDEGGGDAGGEKGRSQDMF